MKKKYFVLMSFLCMFICLFGCQDVKNEIQIGQSMFDISQAIPGDSEISYVTIGDYYLISSSDLKAVAIMENNLVKSFIEYNSDLNVSFSKNVDILEPEKEIWEYLGTPFDEFKETYGEPALYEISPNKSYSEAQEYLKYRRPVYFLNDGTAIQLLILGYYGTESNVDCLYDIYVYDVFTGKILHHYNNLEYNINGTERGELYIFDESSYKWKGAIGGQ